MTEVNPMRSTAEFGRAILRNSITELVDADETSPYSMRGSVNSLGNSSSLVFKTPCVVQKFSAMPALAAPGLVSRFVPKPPELLFKRLSGQRLSFSNAGPSEQRLSFSNAGPSGQLQTTPSPTTSPTTSPTPPPKMERREVVKTASPKSSPSGAIAKNFLKDDEGKKSKNRQKKVNSSFQKKNSTQSPQDIGITNIQSNTPEFELPAGSPLRTTQMRSDAPEFVLPVERKSEMRANAPEFLPMAQDTWNYDELNGNYLVPVKLSKCEELEVEENVVVWRVNNVDKVELFSPSFWVAGVNAKLGIAYASQGICHVSLVCEHKTKLKFDVSVNGRRSGAKVCIGKQFSTTIKIAEDATPQRIAFQALQLMH
eukprot:GEMP01041851.1.p1 GENE.GEMP01041851.1~~GEMP01041851.1.p1  ORF type:complete len:369 (+),score=80.87 GEMP01041851.1:530-1636(+)